MANFVERFLNSKKDESLIILDLGSQDINGTYKPLFNQPGWMYLGIDISDGKNVDIVVSNTYSWKNIPSDYADVFVSGQTFEHIDYIWLTMKEIFRVLKPGGLCCIIAPSSGIEHKYPIDCWRIYPDGFKALANYADFEIIEISTQWEDLKYEDGSDNWHDSVIICRKPKKSTTGLDLHFGWLKELLKKI
jgi:predicted SAM-dependent methyltransferase